MASTKRKKGKGFLDLLAELRNRIYGMTVMDINVPNSVIETEVHRCGIGPSCVARCYLGPGKAASCPRRLTVHLLRASRQVNKEATPILYGYYRFFFVTARHADLWTMAIGDQIKYVRKVFLDAVYRDMWRRRIAAQDANFTSWLQHLQKAYSLESMTLGLKADKSGPYRAEDIAVYLLPVLKGLRQRRHDRGDMSDVVNIIHSESVFNGNLEEITAFVDTIKKELRALLGGAEAAT
ncbi:hypothetical protein Slin15195_G122640 [Septoria linicola]|uniref:Uncharacterized protein n=1 Tax=Septoria linicola TaxID=215465 RepID=A0A9Q9B656_9PEZI|nr:hypothetical protein Slin14017_G078840 [Septoria linicola]USW58945.1 hypothetical protein Slin15195_G122640 [Septoria linicola]